jgi:hypothetical protein
VVDAYKFTLVTNQRSPKMSTLKVPVTISIETNSDGSVTYRFKYGKTQPITLKDGTKLQFDFELKSQ